MGLASPKNLRRLATNTKSFTRHHDQQQLLVANNRKSIVMDPSFIHDHIDPSFSVCNDNYEPSSAYPPQIFAKSHNSLSSRKKESFYSTHRNSYLRKTNGSSIVWKLAAVFLVVILSSENFYRFCSAEPIVPRNARSSLVRPTRVTYGDIEKANRTCAPKDTCAPSRHDRNGAMMNDIKRRNCFCDKQCIVYEDCCVDSPFRRDPNVTYKKSDVFKCVQLRHYGSYYMNSKCPVSWKDDMIKKGCEDPPTTSFDPISSLPITNTRTGLTYKNYYCALCNNQTFTDRMEMWSPQLECPSVTSKDKLDFSNQTINNKLTYRADQGKWGLQLSYGDYEIFHACNVNAFIPDTVTHLVRPCTPVIKECPANYNNTDIHRKCLSYTAQVYHLAEGYRNVHCAICNGISVEILRCDYHSSQGPRNFLPDFNPVAFSYLFDLNPATGNEVGRTKKCAKEEVYDPFFQRCRAVLCAPGQIYKNEQCISVSVSTSKPMNPNFPSDMNEELDGNDLNPLDSNVSESTTSKDGSNASSSASKANNFEICPKIILQRVEYQILENGSVFVEQYGKIISKKDYSVQGHDRLVVCAIETKYYTEKFGRTWGYLSFVGVLISVIFLILHLIACFLVPDLRNLSGKNLASLCVALLLSYSIFLGLPFVSIPSSSCTVMGVILYYGLMASFCWMLVLAWDVSMTLRRATQELRISTGSQWTRFFFYSAFGWLFPGMMMVVAVVAEFLPPDVMPWPYTPNFGTHNCWFGQKPALLIYFAGPVAFILLLNVLLFIDAAKVIASTSIGTAKAKACGPSHKNFQLYVRLALLMGISWILGIVAGYVDVPELWIIFIFFNTLQGLFIFVAFTCSAKTRKVLRTKLCCFNSNIPTASWTWSGGGNHMMRTTSSSSGQTKRSDLEGRDSYDSSHHLSTHVHPTSRNSSPHHHIVHHHHANPVHGGNINIMHSSHPQHGNSPLHHPSFHTTVGNGKMYRSPSTELYRSLQQN